MDGQDNLPGFKVKTAVIMDPISGIKPWKDSTFAMMLEAQRRGHELRYIEPGDLFVTDGRAQALMRPVSVQDEREGWFTLGEPAVRALADMDVILMRKDPPFNMDYIYLTYALDLAEQDGVLVVNRPQSLRDANEKFFISLFPQCCAPCVITRRPRQILDFVNRNGAAVVKPLDGMGGDSIFQLNPGDGNLNVILETITRNGEELVMAQQFIPEISAGDKRILLVDGQAVPYALARLPGEGDFRGNLAKGGRGEGLPLSERDLWICGQVAPELVRRGIFFAGLDVIGDYLTEVNVTSPTCIRELDAEYGLNIAGQLFDALEARLTERSAA